MNNLQIIIIIAATLSIPVSIWAVVYFSARIITDQRIKRDLGNMPSQAELTEWYEQNNAIITYDQRSPTEKNLRS